MEDYYSKTLSGERLQRCYELAPPRVRRYLEAEITFVLEHVRPSDVVLELGCGYGRVLQRVIGHAKRIVGIDTSADSLRLARELLGDEPSCRLLELNAADMTFDDDAFDLVICIQNGISAFAVDQVALMKEAVRVTRPGGKALFSSYSPRFWEARLEWFRLQAAHGLLGEIDEEATGDGVIVCTDGFRATTAGADEFRELADRCGVTAKITEIDGSSLFCELIVPMQNA